MRSSIHQQYNANRPTENENDGCINSHVKPFKHINQYTDNREYVWKQKDMAYRPNSDFFQYNCNSYVWLAHFFVVVSPKSIWIYNQVASDFMCSDANVTSRQWSLLYMKCSRLHLWYEQWGQHDLIILSNEHIRKRRQCLDHFFRQEHFCYENLIVDIEVRCWNV